MVRRLASIQRVSALEPIAGADFIELAQVCGWTCVVGKCAFSVGDLCVFLEIDAVPPQHQVFEWLWVKPKKDADGNRMELTEADRIRPGNFRIRTKKLRGVLSQGLLIPLKELTAAGLLSGEFQEGEDLTERLGVEKYEPVVPPSQGRGELQGSFPEMVPKTDEARVQSVPSVIDELRGHPYVITLKCDGTSATFLIDPTDGEFKVCSRNFCVKDGDNVYWNIARKYNIEAHLRDWADYVIQGEIVGPGIQGNRMGLAQHELRAFNLFELASGRYASHYRADDILDMMDIPTVPVIDTGDDFQHTQETLLALAEGKYPGTNNEREGIVIRPFIEMYSEALSGRLSFKVHSNRYLLKEE